MKTVKVRIAVAVDRDGNWCASGWNVRGDEPDDQYLTECATAEVVPAGIYWLVADLPVPEPVEVAAEVEKAG